jgi:hypothetical protein
MAPDYLSLWRSIGSNAIGMRIGTMTIWLSCVLGSDGDLSVHCPIFLPFGSSLRVSNYRRRRSRLLSPRDERACR